MEELENVESPILLRDANTLADWGDWRNARIATRTAMANSAIRGDLSMLICIKCEGGNRRLYCHQKKTITIYRFCTRS